MTHVMRQIGISEWVGKRGRAILNAHTTAEPLLEQDKHVEFE